MQYFKADKLHSDFLIHIKKHKTLSELVVVRKGVSYCILRTVVL